MLTGRGENAQALDVGREALTVADDLDSDELRARAVSRSAGLGGADDDGGLSDFERSLELAHSLGSPEAIRTSINFSHHLRHRGELRRAIELVEELFASLIVSATVPAVSVSAPVLPQIRYRQGAWDEALELAGVYLDEVQGLHVQMRLALGTRAHPPLTDEDERGLDDSGWAWQPLGDHRVGHASGCARAPCPVSATRRAQRRSGAGVEGSARDLRDRCQKVRFRPPTSSSPQSGSERTAERVLAVARREQVGGCGAPVSRRRVRSRRGRLRGDRLADGRGRARAWSGRSLLEAGTAAPRVRRSCRERSSSSAGSARRTSSPGRGAARATACPRGSRAAPARARSPRRAP